MPNGRLFQLIFSLIFLAPLVISLCEYEQIRKLFVKIVISFFLALGCSYILRLWNEEASCKFIKALV